MTLKDKLKSYNFWISLASAIILILTILGDKFNFDIDSNLILDLSTALCSVFVVLGIISVPKNKTTESNSASSESTSSLSETISNDIKDNLSLLINQSPLSVSISEILNSFVELKENITNLFNKEDEVLKQEEVKEENQPQAEVDNNAEKPLDNLLAISEIQEKTPLINQEIANGFQVDNGYNQTNTLNLESNVSIETYQNSNN